MIKLSQLTDQQIYTAIEAMQNGIAIKPNSEESKALEVSISRAYAELERRAQKKSDQQLTGNSEQFPTKPEWEKQAQLEAVQKSESEPKKQSEPQIIRELSGSYQGEKRVIGTVTDAPVISIPVVEIALSSGTKQMNRTEIMTMLKTWFKRVATSKAMEEGRFSDAYGGAMGQDTWKLFDGWRMIYNETKEGTEYPSMMDCFPGYKNAKTTHKVNAEILWRWSSNDK